MNNIIRPGSPIMHTYVVSKEDIEGMIKSGIPDEIVTATFVPTALECQIRFKAPKAKQGWWIRVQRKIYGEWYLHDSFVDHDLVRHGPEWLEHHHQLIDLAFEETRKDLTPTKH